jgi:hypothetical protein
MILPTKNELRMEIEKLKNENKEIQRAYERLSMIHSETLLRVQDLEYVWMRKTWHGKLIERIRNKILRKKWYD